MLIVFDRVDEKQLSVLGCLAGVYLPLTEDFKSTELIYLCQRNKWSGSLVAINSNSISSAASFPSIVTDCDGGNIIYRYKDI